MAAPKRFTKGIDLYRSQKAYFEGVQHSARRMHFELAKAGFEDWFELTSGTPTGKARLNLLRRLGHPFARGATPETSTPTGRRRGTRARLYTHGNKHGTWGYWQTGKDRLEKNGLAEELPLLPIGQISGRLHESIKLTKRSDSPQQFDVGPRDPGPSIWAVAKGGTRRVVARGIEKEIERRFRPRNKAFVDALKERVKDPN